MMKTIAFVATLCAGVPAAAQLYQIYGIYGKYKGLFAKQWLNKSGRSIQIAEGYCFYIDSEGLHGRGQTCEFEDSQPKHALTVEQDPNGGFILKRNTYRKSGDVRRKGTHLVTIDPSCTARMPLRSSKKRHVNIRCDGGPGVRLNLGVFGVPQDRQEQDENPFLMALAGPARDLVRETADGKVLPPYLKPEMNRLLREFNSVTREPLSLELGTIPLRAIDPNTNRATDYASRVGDTAVMIYYPGIAVVMGLTRKQFDVHFSRHRTKFSCGDATECQPVPKVKQTVVKGFHESKPMTFVTRKMKKASTLLELAPKTTSLYGLIQLMMEHKEIPQNDRTEVVLKVIGTIARFLNYAAQAGVNFGEINTHNVFLTLPKWPKSSDYDSLDATGRFNLEKRQFEALEEKDVKIVGSKGLSTDDVRTPSNKPNVASNYFDLLHDAIEKVEIAGTIEDKPINAGAKKDYTEVVAWGMRQGLHGEFTKLRGATPHAEVVRRLCLFLNKRDDSRCPPARRVESEGSYDEED